MKFPLTLFIPLVLVSPRANAQSGNTLPPPGQPLRTGILGGFEIIGNSLVSAQQVSCSNSSWARELAFLG